MRNQIAANLLTKRKKSDFTILFSITMAILFFVGSGALSYWNTHVLHETNGSVTRTHDTITTLYDLLSAVKDAETGQRGFLMTGDEKYLLPYNNSMINIHQHTAKLEKLLDNPDDINAAKAHIKAKLDELAETIMVRRTRGLEAALAIVRTDRGKIEMDALRALVDKMKLQEQEIREQRIEMAQRAYITAIFSGTATTLLGVLLSAVIGMMLLRTAEQRRRQEWLQSGESGLAAALLGNQKMDELGANILKFLAEYFDAHAGAFFTKEDAHYERTATYGVPAQNSIPEKFQPGHGLLWQCVEDQKTFLINDVPDGYLTVGSALGQDKPRQIIIAPGTADGISNAVIELGFVHPVNPLAMELLKSAAETIGIAVRSAHYRTNLQNLLEETQRQAEELQAQSEELRVSNEELEEQSRALQESQSRLEQQQAEMEQNNAQLEEQTQLLEAQRDDLEQAQSALQLRTRELEQASQYKTDFLANMSHELRTPLNSSLILAKLLADNPEGNLSGEQIRYAETIQSSGNDLLGLINDILDLSKIEAGHMEIRAENIYLSKLSDDLKRMFEPLAKDKNLDFNIEIAANCPVNLLSDGKRLEQVLKNLLSNAIKFTEKGTVKLAIERAKSNQLAFSVSDTGIGISPEQHNVIFEAFRQADGTTNRKYGGTGLGLSISRELARLLGGEIQLKSAPGKGSTFVLAIPEQYNANAVNPRTGNLPVRQQLEDIQPKADKKSVKQKQVPLRTLNIIDDRETLKKDKRTILVVEDDESFVKILYDLAHELGFQCIIATTADEAIYISSQYLPHAVLLDVGLPDHSGLSVLDRLKQDSLTRHIPVHILSAHDYAHTAYSLGAVGYMLKPVKREQLIDAMKKLETHLEHGMRRILIVEDDEVQRESMKKLLSSHDVETIAVGTAAECLEKLKSEIFDCMVLDLSLPDASGHSLLKTLSQEDRYSFPPAIVYTGRDLSAAQEEELRKYSKSIIIKGAKSPERLLDEVTLFLHQVVADLPPEQQQMLKKAKHRDAILEGRTILVVEDDIRNVYAVRSILEPRGATVQISRNGREALEALEKAQNNSSNIDLVLMDVMMPEMDGLTATRAIRKKKEWKKLPIIMLTAKAMKDDQERCIEAGANDYMAKPLDVEKLLSLVRVWMPR